MKGRVAWVAVIVILGLLGIGTVSNVLRLNATSEKIRAQAESGQAALDRQCKLLPVGRKLYTDALKRGVISGDDFELVLSSANVACSRP